MLKRLKADQYKTPLAVFAFLLGLIFVGPLSFVLSREWLLPLPAWVLPLAFCAIYLLRAGPKGKLEPAELFKLCLIFAALIMLSDWATRPYAALSTLEPSILSRTPLVIFSFVAALLSYYLSGWLAPYIVIAFAILLANQFLLTLDYGLIFSDDHPTFLFRFLSIKESFPFIPSYYPLWNAGIEFRDFFASGALAVYFLFLPLMELTDISRSYTLVVALLLFACPLLSSYLTTKFLKKDRRFFALLSFLMLTNSTIWYRWALSFGTLGFLLAAQILPVALSLTARIAGPAVFSRGEILVAISAITLMLLWPISVLFLPPILLFILLNFRIIAAKKSAWIALALIVIINLPWMLVFSKASSVGSFVTRTAGENIEADTPINEAIVTIKSSPSEKLSVSSILSAGRQSLAGVHPAILLLSVAGLIAACPAIRTLYLVQTIWLLALAAFGPLIRPQLELDRFWLVAAICLATPAACILYQILEMTKRFSAATLGYRTALMFLISGGIFSAFNSVSNATNDKFFKAAPIVSELASAISHFGGNGRVLFAGFTLHELSNGHIAPLPYLTKKPLIARSYKHDHWDYSDVIPPRFRRDKGARVDEFLDLYNVTAVITHDKNWRNFFRKRKTAYSEVWHSGRFRIFKRSAPKEGYFYSGQGEVISQSADGVKLRLFTPNAVIKFNHVRNLSANGCKIGRRDIEQPISFIELTDCPVNSEIHIGMNMWK